MAERECFTVQIDQQIEITQIGTIASIGQFSTDPCLIHFFILAKYAMLMHLSPFRSAERSFCQKNLVQYFDHNSVLFTTLLYCHDMHVNT